MTLTQYGLSDATNSSPITISDIKWIMNMPVFTDSAQQLYALWSQHVENLFPLLFIIFKLLIISQGKVISGRHCAQKSILWFLKLNCLFKCRMKFLWIFLVTKCYGERRYMYYQIIMLQLHSRLTTKMSLSHLYHS